MSNYACLERYIPLVEFMGKICGKNYEIILHDVSTPERSVIAACNEHLSGRRIGDPMTEMAKELLLTSDMTVVQIAETLNYSNVQNFIRFFSKKVGMTPGKYRKDYQNEKK